MKNTPINQGHQHGAGCDGCRAKMILARGRHYDKNNRVVMMCTRNRYIPNIPYRETYMVKN